MSFVQPQQNLAQASIARVNIARARPLPLPATRQLTLHRGDHLYRAGDPMEDIYLVTAGVLKCYRDTERGEEQVTGFYQAGDFCGFDNLASKVATSNAVALDTTNLEVLPMRDLNTVPVFSGNGFQQEMMHEMGRELQRLMNLLKLERCSAEQRVVSFLLQHSAYEKRRGCTESDFVLPMTRRDIAHYLNIACETLSRVLSRLQDEGMLEFCRNRIVLKDIPALQRRLESEGLNVGSD